MNYHTRYVTGTVFKVLNISRVKLSQPLKSLSGQGTFRALVCEVRVSQVRAGGAAL